MQKNEAGVNLVDCGCGRLIPTENMNTSIPGTFGSMLKDLYTNSSVYQASTNYGFKPGFTIGGKNYDWGSATFHK